MNSSKRSIEEDLKVIVDTNIIFSAIIYPDGKDRPIFIFAYRLIQSNENIYLVSGDSDLRTKKVKKELKNRSITTGKLLSLL